MHLKESSVSLSQSHAYARVREEDEAFAWLDKTYGEHAQWLSEIKTDPGFDPIRLDCRFLCSNSTRTHARNTSANNIEDCEIGRFCSDLAP